MALCFAVGALQSSAEAVAATRRIGAPQGQLSRIRSLSPWRYPSNREQRELARRAVDVLVAYSQTPRERLAAVRLLEPEGEEIRREIFTRLGLRAAGQEEFASQMAAARVFFDGGMPGKNDSDGAAGEAIGNLNKEGLDLGIEEVRVIPDRDDRRSVTLSGATLILSKNAAADPGLARRLIVEKLRQGLPGPMRWSRREAAGVPAGLPAAAAYYKKRWARKLNRLPISDGGEAEFRARNLLKPLPDQPVQPSRDVGAVSREALSRFPWIAGRLEGHGAGGWSVRTDRGEKFLPAEGLDWLLFDRTSSPELDGELGRTLARALTERPDRAEIVAEVVREHPRPVRLAHVVWDELSRRLLALGLPSVPAALAADSARWFSPHERTVIKERMPTLWRALNEPKRLSSFLLMLSFLRLVFPYTVSAASPLPPVEYAARTGIVFPLGELDVIPGSESFRRYILVARSPGRPFAAEIKIPGQDSDRRLIDAEHFSVARDYWRRHPDGTGVVKPIYFGRFRGKASLYGRSDDFNEEGLGVALFEFQDGKRLENLLANRRWTRAIREALADAAAASVRLHQMGYSGRIPGVGGDMHDGNVRVLLGGGGTLVGDFNAFHKPAGALASHERRRETLKLLGRPPRRVRAAVFPQALKRLMRGLDPHEREKSADALADELDYRPKHR